MLVTSVILILLSNVTAKRRDITAGFNRAMLTVLLGALMVGISSVVILKTGVGLLAGLFHCTSLTISFHIFIIFISLIIIQLTAFFPRLVTVNGLDLTNYNNFIYNLYLSDKVKQQYSILEYPLIILFIIVGSMFLISSSNIISIFIAIELQSYGLYLLCALYRNSESSTGAGLIYFLLGGLSSCFILLASGLLYTNSGTSSMDCYYIIANITDLKINLYNILYWYNNDYINYCLVIMSVGFLFKISAAPFHFWSPDIYDAIPTVVTTFVANIAKLSILVFLMEIVHYTSNLVISNFNWTDSLLLSSLLSLIIGTVLGLDQTRIKRLLAYSTISHLGFILLAIAINSVESVQAFTFYLMQYAITNINAFIIIIGIGYTLYMYKKQEDKKSENTLPNKKPEGFNTEQVNELDDFEASLTYKKQQEIERIKNNKLIDENNSPIQYIAQFKGYYYTNPLVAVSLSIVIFSFVGIPPLVGFFGKQMVLSSAMDKGYIFISLVAILTSVVSAVYYLNVIKQMFFDKPDYTAIIINIYKNGHNYIASKINSNFSDSYISVLLNRDYSLILSTNLSSTISMLTLVILLFMLNPDQWLSISNILAMLMFY